MTMVTGWLNTTEVQSIDILEMSKGYFSFRILFV